VNARGKRIALWIASAPFLFGREILCGTNHIGRTDHLRNDAVFSFVLAKNRITN
jgi:hypothetical protein